MDQVPYVDFWGLYASTTQWLASSNDLSNQDVVTKVSSHKAQPMNEKDLCWSACAPHSFEVTSRLRTSSIDDRNLEESFGNDAESFDRVHTSEDLTKGDLCKAKRQGGDNDWTDELQAPVGRSCSAIQCIFCMRTGDRITTVDNKSGDNSQVRIDTATPILTSPCCGARPLRLKRETEDLQMLRRCKSEPALTSLLHHRLPTRTVDKESVEREGLGSGEKILQRRRMMFVYIPTREGSTTHGYCARKRSHWGRRVVERLRKLAVVRGIRSGEGVRDR
ncbi:hypothetical protein K431DRAFT_281318 [Polychaeton citri CBS 116435]|uniref:Uncharacterized protein n=1 Tax=Polychaeton citri CBS 116435 TaxID=1314669 RepID=A0A9P4QDS1_9PEZI|nr:hypothetical protein K431DRAFT_281318 [Polychaeton citri CBS 116435]